MPLDPLPDPARHVVRGACPHDCPDTCAMLVTVEDGRAVRVQGDPDHPTTHGALCTKVSRYAERSYHPDRVLQPLKRVGRKGSGRFEAVSWESALADIAARLQEAGEGRELLQTELASVRVRAADILATIRAGIITVDELRYGIENLGADAYENLSYYERWIASVTRALQARGVITTDELGRKMAGAADKR